MSRFSVGVAPEDLDHVEQPALAEDRDDGPRRGDELAQVRVVAGLVGRCRGRPEGRQLRGARPAHRSRAAAEELESFGFVPANRPP